MIDLYFPFFLWTMIMMHYIWTLTEQKNSAQYKFNDLRIIGKVAGLMSFKKYEKTNTINNYYSLFFSIDC